MAVKKKAGPPKENKNAEKWSVENAAKLFNDAIALANEYDKKERCYTYDFIGEIARKLSSYKEVFTYLKDRFPNELTELHRELVSTLEANCFYNSKKGKINTAIGIVNLKSNHNWTDRTQVVNDTQVKPIEFQIVSSKPAKK